MYFSNSIVNLLLLAGPAFCYSKAATNALHQLGSNITQTNNYINTLQGCGYVTTTQAITANAPVNGGSACSSADSSIASKLVSTSNGIQSALSLLKSSRSSQEATSNQTISAFNDFATAFYALFNAMDLAECTYKLTTASKCFAIQFNSNNSPPSLRDGYNGIVAELSNDASTAFQIAGTNFKQQTHFGGTSFLATQVGGLEVLALAGCDVITGIVTSEGGGSS